MKKEEIKKITSELSSDLSDIKVALDELSVALDCLKDGDDKGFYWMSRNAYQFYKNCITQLNCNYDIVNQLEKNMPYLESLSK